MVGSVTVTTAGKTFAGKTFADDDDDDDDVLNTCNTVQYSTVPDMVDSIIHHCQSSCPHQPNDMMTWMNE